MADRALPMGVGLSNQTSIIAATTAAVGTLTSDVLIGCNRFDAAIFMIVLANRGSGSTVDIKLQQLGPDSTTWYDIAAMTQLAANATTMLVVVSGVATIEFTRTDATMAAATIKSVPFAERQRIKAIVGTDVFDVTIHAQYLRRFAA